MCKITQKVINGYEDNQNLSGDLGPPSGSRNFYFFFVIELILARVVVLAPSSCSSLLYCDII